MRTVRLSLLALATVSVGLVALPTAAVAAPQCRGIVATIVGTDGRDELVGTQGRDVIVGGGGWDRIRGRGGNDLICGGNGADRIRGGPGNDRLFGGPDGYIPENGPFGDTLRGGPGDDRLRGVGASGLDRIVYDTARHGIVGDLASGVLTGQGRDRFSSIEAMTGSPRRDDLLIGGRTLRVAAGAGADVVRCRVNRSCSVSGGPGDDRLVDVRSGSGDGGDDRIIGRAGKHGVLGADLYGGAGDDVILGSEGKDDVLGGHGADRIRTGAGDDEIEAGAGNNTVRAGAGDDLVWDGPDRDAIRAGPGADTVKANQGARETIDLGRGNDTIDYLEASRGGVRIDVAAGVATGAAGHDELIGAVNAVGSHADDVILGSAAAQHLDAMGGDDTIRGRGGDDDIEDDYGADAIYAGPGDDVIRLNNEYAGHSDDRYAGGAGSDTFDATWLSPTPIDSFVVDLAAGEASGAGEDVLSGLEHVIGTIYEKDVIRGDDGPNRLEGRGDDDTLIGRGGDDVLHGDAGDDDADGGDGIDTCVAETVTNCER